MTKNFDKIGTEEFEYRYGTLIDGQKKRKLKTTTHFYVPFFLTRRFIYSLILVVLNEKPKASLVLCILSTFLFLLYFFFTYPYEKKRENILGLTNYHINYI